MIKNLKLKIIDLIQFFASIIFLHLVSCFLLLYTLITMENKIITRGVDVLIYLLIIISLCTSLYHVINILFSVIDFKFGDNLNNIYEWYNDGIRFSIASLIVMFPIYFGLSFYTARVLSKDKSRIESWPRKFTIYASIFITSLTLIGSLISVLYKFLGGELTTAFLLKVLVVMVLALTIGGYYLYNLYRDFSKVNYISKIFSTVSIILVIVSVTLGICVFGTPSEIRAKKYDSERLSDLSAIQNQVLYYWQQKKVLPESLMQLNDPLQGFAVPLDPKDKTSYKYEIIKQSKTVTENGKQIPTDASFKICANFETERKIEGYDTNNSNVVSVKPVMGSDVGFSQASFNYYYEGSNNPFWNHGVGEHCFERNITKEMYPVR